MAAEKEDKPVEQPPKETKTATLGEDDEFEDFPVDGTCPSTAVFYTVFP